MVLDHVKYTKSALNKLKSLSSINSVGGWVYVYKDKLKGTDRKAIEDMRLIKFKFFSKKKTKIQA